MSNTDTVHATDQLLSVKKMATPGLIRRSVAILGLGVGMANAAPPPPALSEPRIVLNGGAVTVKATPLRGRP
jgi:hypothetical protein